MARYLVISFSAIPSVSPFFVPCASQALIHTSFGYFSYRQKARGAVPCNVALTILVGLLLLPKQFKRDMPTVRSLMLERLHA